MNKVGDSQTTLEITSSSELIVVAGCPGTGKTTYIQKNLLNDSAQAKDNSNTEKIPSYYHFSSWVGNSDDPKNELNSKNIIHLDLLSLISFRLPFWPCYFSKRSLMRNIQKNLKLARYHMPHKIEVIFLMIEYDIAASQYQKRQNGIRDKYIITRRSVLYSSSSLIKYIFQSKKAFDNINIAFLMVMSKIDSVKEIRIIL